MQEFSRTSQKMCIKWFESECFVVITAIAESALRCYWYCYSIKC